jgi:hypothetical protein
MPSALLMDPEAQQVYSKTRHDPRVLWEAAALWTIHSLEQSGGAVLEVTRNTWKHVKTRLSEEGHDPATLQEEDRLVVFDAHKVIVATTAGVSSPHNFKQAITGAVEKVRQRTGNQAPLHVWTEHAAMLRERDDPWLAAFQESLWKEAARENDLRLLGTTILDNTSSFVDAIEGWSEYVMGSTHDPATQR